MGRMSKIDKALSKRIERLMQKFKRKPEDPGVESD